VAQAIERVKQELRIGLEEQLGTERMQLRAEARRTIWVQALTLAPTLALTLALTLSLSLSLSLTLTLTLTLTRRAGRSRSTRRH